MGQKHSNKTPRRHPQRLKLLVIKDRCERCGHHKKLLTDHQVKCSKCGDKKWL